MAWALYMFRETFQPEDPQILDSHIKPETKLTFVDFVPNAVERTSTAIYQTAEIKYHPFREMILLANDWLAENPSWRAINCESVTLLFKANDTGNLELRPIDASFYIYGSAKQHIVKALRLWIKRKPITGDESDSYGGETIEPQILDYIDIIPENRGDGDSFCPKFENLNQCVERINKMTQERKINGTIITIESLNCEAEIDWKINPEQTLNFFTNKTVTIIRIFYEKGPPNQLEIGIKDFVPKNISGGGFFKRPKFEAFSLVLTRATRWLSENPDISLRNAQSLDIKLKSLGSCDLTCSMAYTEHGDYLKIFRIAYTKCPKSQSTLSLNLSNAIMETKSLILGSKLFMPIKKGESLTEIRQRMEDWINTIPKDQVNGEINRPIEILSAETVEVFCRSDDNELEKAVEDTFQYNRFGTKNGYIFISLRVYFGLPGLPNLLISRVDDNLIQSMSLTNDNGSSCNIL
ncbi:uncharacterized protein LOC128390628 isoform X2 [Panonychus citri]|uniref:uncharacterized protein LOC128390628 isoform X2 n=1 Tax=Panonychus citri TaxID=50023 RepID=UPI002306E602|nr:uncharacterized protein LOC128390628 isoform X2 [Panonychus citri]